MTPSYGKSAFGTSSWGSVITELPAVVPVTVAPSTIPREWPFLVGMEGKPWAESVDPFELLLAYGDEAILYIGVLLSLFTDARAPAEADLPVPDNNRRGWWADSLRLRTIFQNNARPIGSQLWLLSRARDDSATPLRVKQYSEKALQWFIDAGLATDVSVQAVRIETGTTAAMVQVTHKTGHGIKLRHPDFWRIFDAYHH